MRLAELADTDPMMLVRILDRMERDGWVERHAYLTENPPIPVVLVKLDNHGLPGDQIRQLFLGLSPECLAPFRSVNTLQPDLVLGLAGIEDYDGIAVCDAYDSPCENFSLCQGEDEKQKYGNRDP